ncbi:hypothetical protein ACHWQZ_G007671 [Mnemiopsis leidyi]
MTSFNTALNDMSQLGRCCSPESSYYNGQPLLQNSTEFCEKKQAQEALIAAKMVNDQELKAGHAPATKVGGARRTRNRSRSDNVGGMAGEPAPEEVTPGEEGTEETPAEEVKVSSPIVC